MPKLGKSPVKSKSEDLKKAAATPSTDTKSKEAEKIDLSPPPRPQIAATALKPPTATVVSEPTESEPTREDALALLPELVAVTEAAPVELTTTVTFSPLLALAPSCGSFSASGASSRPTGNLCSPRARPSSKNSACADGADHQPGVKIARPGVAVRVGSREALSAPRVVARGCPQPIEAAQGAAASESSRERDV